MCFSIVLSDRLIIVKKIEGHMIKNVYWSSRKVLLMLLKCP